MIDACSESAVLFFDVDGTLTSFDPDDMTDKDFKAVADYVTDDVVHDGTVTAMQHFGLI